MKNILIIILICCSFVSVFAQDAFFSNYANAPLQLNPALTGQINGRLNRLKISNRDQWRSVLKKAAFRTQYISFDKRICTQERGDFWGFGVNLLADKRGEFPLQRLDFMVSTSYTKHLLNISNGRKLYIGAGIEGGAINHNLGQKGLTFDEQFDTPDAPGEFFDNYNFTVFDYGAGLSIYLAGENLSAFSFNFGASAKHLGEPIFQFIESENGNEIRLKRRYTFYGNIVFPIRKKHIAISLKSVFTYQEPFTQLLGGFDFIFKSNNYLFTIGASLRQVNNENNVFAVSDALVASTAIIFNQFSVSIHYDANISTLRTASSSIGALELSLGYVFGEKGCKLVYCPNF